MQYEKPQLSITIKQFLTISGQFLTLKLKKKKEKCFKTHTYACFLCLHVFST